MQNFPLITLSIVSHQQILLVEKLFRDFETYKLSNINVILTLNTNEQIPESFQQFTFPIEYIKNTQLQGFGQNHNAAFKRSHTPYFCVLNPDIRLTANPFSSLVESMLSEKAGLIAPAIVDSHHLGQDSARVFPTLRLLLKRMTSKHRGLDYEGNTPVILPDWVAGMFMLFEREAYQSVGGFDEKFYLYCEDIDICARLHQKRIRLCQDRSVVVIHEARRDSHKKAKYTYWHIQSMLRFLFRYYTGHYKNKGKQANLKRG